MYLCPPDCPCLLHPLWIVCGSLVCPCVALWLCVPVTPLVVQAPCLECVHAYMYLCPCKSTPSYLETTPVTVPCLLVAPPLFSMCTCSTWVSTWLPIYGLKPVHSLFLMSQSPHFSPTPCLECVHALVHEFMSKWLLICLVNSLCIVWWKPGCPCMAVCLCPSHLISLFPPLV